MPRRIHCLLIVLLLAALSDSAQAAESEVTARSIFALLPESIFENTPEGLSPQEKQKLLSAGHSEFWEIAGETDDVLVFASMPFRDTAVALRLFRNAVDGSVLAAFGTLGGAVCTLELWRVDASGRAVPVDTPQEPDISAFFCPGPQNAARCSGYGHDLPWPRRSQGAAHVLDQYGHGTCPGRQ